jgi:hypothetical protein
MFVVKQVEEEEDRQLMARLDQAPLVVRQAQERLQHLVVLQ